MSLIIPNTFADKTSDLQLASLDANFSYLTTQLDNTNNNLTQFALSLSQSVGISLGNWTIYGGSDELTFAYMGVNKMKLDSSGNLSVTGDVTAIQNL